MREFITGVICLSVLAPQAQAFSLDRFRVFPNHEHKWGYLNTQGVEVIAPKYFRADAFNHGYATCFGVDEKSGATNCEKVIYVDKKGH